jgi:hypothetical protein
MKIACGSILASTFSPILSGDAQEGRHLINSFKKIDYSSLWKRPRFHLSPILSENAQESKQ